MVARHIRPTAIPTIRRERFLGFLSWCKTDLHAFWVTTPSVVDFCRRWAVSGCYWRREPALERYSAI
jgi:hypothetical protein